MSLFIVALLVSAQAPATQPAVDPAQQAPVAATSQKPKKICKIDEGDSASRMSKRVCKTAEEWSGQPRVESSRSGMSLSGEAMQSH